MYYLGSLSSFRANSTSLEQNKKGECLLSGDIKRATNEHNPRHIVISAKVKVTI